MQQPVRQQLHCTLCVSCCGVQTTPLRFLRMAQGQQVGNYKNKQTNQKNPTRNGLQPEHLLELFCRQWLEVLPIIGCFATPWPAASPHWLVSLGRSWCRSSSSTKGKTAWLFPRWSTWWVGCVVLSWVCALCGQTDCGPSGWLICIDVFQSGIVCFALIQILIFERDFCACIVVWSFRSTITIIQSLCWVEDFGYQPSVSKPILGSLPVQNNADHY